MLGKLANGTTIGVQRTLQLAEAYPSARIVIEHNGQQISLSLTNTKGEACWFNLTASTWGLIHLSFQEVFSLNPDAVAYIHRRHTVCWLAERYHYTGEPFNPRLHR